MYTRVLPSISIDDGVFRHCSLVAFAEGLDHLNGPEWSKMAFARPAVWLHLQKFVKRLVCQDDKSAFTFCKLRVPAGER